MGVILPRIPTPILGKAFYVLLHNNSPFQTCFILWFMPTSAVRARTASCFSLCFQGSRHSSIRHCKYGIKCLLAYLNRFLPNWNIILSRKTSSRFTLSGTILSFSWTHSNATTQVGILYIKTGTLPESVKQGFSCTFWDTRGTLTRTATRHTGLLFGGNLVNIIKYYCLDTRSYLSLTIFFTVEMYLCPEFHLLLRLFFFHFSGRFTLF